MGVGPEFSYFVPVGYIKSIKKKKKEIPSMVSTTETPQQKTHTSSLAWRLVFQDISRQQRLIIESFLCITFIQKWYDEP